MLTFLIHFTSLFALALWVGGGSAISFLVAPVVFERAGSSQRAGEIVGQVLKRFDFAALIAGAVALAASGLELAGTVGATRALALKLTLISAMVGLVLFSRWAVAPEVAQLRERLGPNLDLIPREDPLRQKLTRLHGYSVLCLLGELVCGAFALALGVMTLSLRMGS